jgi:hypothetical protein
VHAFAQSAIGPLFFGFISITFVASMALLFRRWNSLKSETQLDSLLSREAAFLLNNFLFLGIAFATLWGTIFPLISELVTGQKVTVGPPYYNQVNGPLLAALVLLMGIAPLVAWRKASARSLGRLMWIPAALTVVAGVLFYFLGARTPLALAGYGIAAFVGLTTLSEFARGTLARMRLGENPLAALINLAARNRRRYGGYTIHLRFVVMAFGVIGSTFFQQQTKATLAEGEKIALGGFTMRYDSLAQFSTDDGRDVARATVSVFDNNGIQIATLHPRRDFFFDSQQPMTIPGVRSTLGEDFYVLLVGWEPIAAGGATFPVGTASSRKEVARSMRAVDAVMECLKAEGVEVVFGLPGGANIPTYDALYDAGIRHVLVRHEAGGGHAAEGYAKATGKVGVSLGTSGPGATNLVTPIVDAMMDSVPVVFITGQVRTDLLGTDGFQEADVMGITMPGVKHSIMIRHPTEIPRALHEAFHLARTGRPGPVVVDIPTDLSRADIPYEPVTDVRLPGYQVTSEGNTKQIRQAAKALAAARRPVIYAGGGVRGGQVLGSTDREGAYCTSRSYSPAEAVATVYRAVGVDPSTMITNRDGRSAPIQPTGEPIPVF